MKMSGGVEWALHCAFALTAADRPASAARLAEMHDVSASYLAKQLQAMSRAGLVRSAQGHAGGYELTRPPSEITVLDVVEAIDGRTPAFLCTEVARWVADEGLSLDVCSGGELAVALRAGFPAQRIAFHGNNKSIDEITAVAAWEPWKIEGRGSMQWTTQVSWLSRKPWSAGAGPASADVFMFLTQVRYNLP